MEITQIIQHPFLAVVPKPILYMFLAYLIFKMLDFVTGLLKTWKKVVAYKSGIMRDGIDVGLASL